MPKTAILYLSPHHGNTKKLLDAIAAAHPDVRLFEAGKETFDPAQYDLVGFASGIYMSKMHKAVVQAMEAMEGGGRKAFLLFTCGDSHGGKFSGKYLDLLRQRGFAPCGVYWALGHDSFGPFRLIGGLNKGRPNAEEIAGAVRFYEGLLG